METLIDPADKRKIGKYTMALILVLAVFVGIKAINALKEYSYIGKDVPPMNSISVTGKGETYMIPDTASFVYTVLEEGKTATEAQDKSTAKTNAVLAALEKADIEEKDIKTVSYNINPKYEYRSNPRNIDGSCPMGYCTDGKSVIIGYEVSQSIEVKVRDIEKAGDILALVGGLNVSNVSGLSFVIDDMEAAKAEVRKQAIQDAKEKAKVISKELGVKFDEIISFYESGQDGYPMPMAEMGYGGTAYATMDAKVAPSLPVGENKLTTMVTITYSIK